ncbi:MAG: alpha-galactosidase [Actinobacteria bacterium]|nr:alpha-galactosidase [Actinomycetota bacterium]
MLRRPAAGAAAVALVGGSLLAAVPAAAATTPDGVVAKVTATSATLSDGEVSRAWSLGGDGTVRTTSLRGNAGELSAASSPDFRIDVDGAPTTSVLGWSLISATAGAIPPDSSRPDAAPGKQLTFRYALGDNHLTTVGVELDRVVALHEGSAVLEVTSTLINRTPAAVRIGQYSLDELTPVASMTTGRAEVIGYSGGSDWRDDYRHVLSEPVGFDDEGETARFDNGGGLNGTVLARQIDRAAALGIDSYMIDDQWQGGTGGESGDWRFDPVRFPDTDGNGTPDFVDYVHSKGIKLGLWMSPAEFNTASQTYAAHPDWACAPTGDVTAQIPDDAGLGVWDMTNASLRDHLTGVVDRLVVDYDVREFKFDFQTWVDCGTHDYNDYEDAFVGWVHEQQRRHPAVTIELDETNDQRAWPFESAAIGPSWFDNGHLHGSGGAAKLLHDMWTAAPWLPTSGIGVGSFDGTLADGCGPAGTNTKYPCSSAYLAPLMLLGHITFWTDTTKIPDADASEIAWWTAWYKAHRDDLRGAVRELASTDPLDGTSSTAFQTWRDGHGELFAFRQAGTSPSLRVSVQSLDPTTSYAVRDVRSGELLTTATGAALASGYDIALPQTWSARVLSIDPAEPQPPVDVPEAPVALLLPLTALAVGGLLVRRRLRRTA